MILAHRKHSIIRLCFVFVFALIICTAASGSHLSFADQEEETVVVYKGVANREVRVRTGPGTEFEQVVYNNRSLYLSAQTECLITDTAVASNGKDWYRITYDAGDMEIDGYVFAEYVTKNEMVEPVVTEAPEPTATPTPKPTSTPTPEPTETPAPVVTEAPEPESSSKVSVVVVAVIVVVIALVVFVVLSLLKKVKRLENAAQKESAKNVDRLKKLKLDESQIRSGHRQIQIKQAGSSESETASEEKPAKNSEKEIVKTEPVLEAVRESASRLSQDKKELRSDIENLVEHDIVTHKIFGEGEVYDNSDVRLIEIRFGNDARFLNKDQLAAKQLLEVTESGEIKKRIASRRSRRSRNE